MVLYEYPFNESIRTMLRLEHLFDRLGALMERETPLDHHFALVTLFEIMDVASRADLKADLLKELERHKSQFMVYRGNPSVEQERLNEVIGRIENAYQRLNALAGKAGAVLASNDWLMSIRSRISIPGGTCEFDLPAYYNWQQLLPVRRRKDLMGWAQTLMPMAEALQVLLGLLRDSGSPHKVAANAGQYQQSLPAGRVYQLLRMRIDPSLGLIPEITGHRLLVSIRMMRQDEEGRLKLASQDTSFELTLCA
ncbi:MAG: cell division protein ZapD [Roseateles depolymerans]|uniref:Cell division protein ZapD n=1 Tax=Roseateles depolymerans TaxID=76731 RepID=A0A2W5E368_9BURK|nr:MAG: cell division protein ZapD [Roseateles depolymerans]